MPDHMTPQQRSLAMKRVKLRNGSIERVIHQELKTRSLKFRRHVRSLPGSPDIVFNGCKVAIFIDGDFWHGWRLSTWEQKLSLSGEKNLEPTASGISATSEGFACVAGWSSGFGNINLLEIEKVPSGEFFERCPQTEFMAWST